LLPFQVQGDPHQRLLLDLLEIGNTWEILTAAERIADRLGAATRDDAYWAIREKYEKLLGYPLKKGTNELAQPPQAHAWGITKPWENITHEDVRCCLIASALLLVRTRVFVAPSVLMALWVWEGKIRRNRFYRHPYAEVAPPPDNVVKPTLGVLRQFLGYLLDGDGVTFSQAIALERRGTFPTTRAFRDELHKAFPNRLKTTFAEINKDVARYRWWAWSHTMPHFWSLDVAVARHPQRPFGIHLPPTPGGRNISRWYSSWLTELTALGALTQADINSVMEYSSTAGGGFEVNPVAHTIEENSWWRIRMNPDEAARVIPLHLYLLGAYFLECKRRIANAARPPAPKASGAAPAPALDPAEIPDSAAYAAYNWTIDGVIGNRSRLEPKVLRTRFESRLGPNEHALFLNDVSRGSDAMRINTLRFLYVRDVLAPLMQLPSRL
jgi:hypothetical protein